MNPVDPLIKNDKTGWRNWSIGVLIDSEGEKSGDTYLEGGGGGSAR
jgi:hypothetical protein